jgi:hypothetical protein
MDTSFATQWFRPNPAGKMQKAPTQLNKLKPSVKLINKKPGVDKKNIDFQAASCTSSAGHENSFM